MPPVEIESDRGWSLLTSAVAGLEHLDLQVEPILDVGRPARILLEHARHAQLVVVGSRGHGDFSALLLGSTSLQVAMHAPCPVIVVRWPRPGAVSGPSVGRIVVGIDGSELSESAVAFAFDEADRRDVGLTALHAWESPLPEALPTHEWQAVEDEERALLAERLAGWGEKYPDVDVDHRVVRGDAIANLVAESVGAELTVVGSRGAGGFRGLVLGSVSHGLLHHAGSPVAVVRAVHDSR
jgi:nucleotide-binding universal stress UspA family protein